MANTYLGHGRLFLNPAGATDNTTEVEIALVQDLTITTSMETKELLDKSSSVSQVYQEIMTRADYTVKFSTADISTQVLKMAFLGTAGAATAITAPAGSALPAAGYVAGATTVTKIEAGKATQWVGSLRFEADAAAGDDRAVYFHNVALKPDGDLALISDDFAKISFSGKCGKDANGNIITFGIKAS